MIVPACTTPVADGMVVDTRTTPSPKPRRASSNTCSSTIRSTARCATAAANARSRTRPWPTGRGEPLRRGEAPLRSPSRSPSWSCSTGSAASSAPAARFSEEISGDPLIRVHRAGLQHQVNTFPNEPFRSYFSGNTVRSARWAPCSAHRTASGPAVDLREVALDLPPLLGRRLDQRPGLPERGAAAPRRRLPHTNQSWLSDKCRFGYEFVNSAGVWRRRS